jgi:hypothetical protein
MVIVSISLMTGLGNLRKPVQLALKTPRYDICILLKYDTTTLLRQLKIR